jgi:microcystin-dependent protein
MAKTKISEFSATAADNTDITNINIAEGCSPANVNNSIRSLMALLKDQQAGTSGDPFTCSGTLVSSGTIDVTGGFKLDGSAGTSGQVIVSAGTGTPTWGSGFPSGGIIMWSGTIATIPSGWLLCNGSSGTPDLRNRFVIGAFSDTTGVAYTTITGANTQTGGTKDAIVVSHTHTATSTVTDPGHNHTVFAVSSVGASNLANVAALGLGTITTSTATTGITVATTNASTGSSGTDQNLVPYFALAYIMKS